MVQTLIQLERMFVWRSKASSKPGRIGKNPRKLEKTYFFRQISCPAIRLLLLRQCGGRGGGGNSAASRGQEGAKAVSGRDGEGLGGEGLGGGG